MTIASHSNPLTGPQPAGAASGPELQRCEQCGRVGVRGFRVLPATEYTKPITLCASKAACRKRWPKPHHEIA
ncbi:hypothetical protein V2E29_04690 [Streptomyces diastatochromogenes]|uniref:hypothetical protein n=1 Tax=Streptomyces diastatochromogenes TaxID=42236 RepID=UPI002F26D710